MALDFCNRCLTEREHCDCTADQLAASTPTRPLNPGIVNRCILGRFCPVCKRARNRIEADA